MNPKIKTTLSVSILLALSCAHSAPKGGLYEGLGEKSVSPATLRKYAPQDLSSDVTRKIESYLDLRAPSLGIPSPDGKHLFFNWRVTGTSQVWRVDGPGKFPIQLTGGEDATQVLAVTKDGEWIVVERDRKGEENPGLYLQRSSGGPLQVIQHKSGVQTMLNRLGVDGRSIYYASNDVKPDSYALYRYDLKTRAAERFFSEPGIWSVEDERPSGELLLVKVTGSTWTEYYNWDPATKKLEPVIGVDEHEEYSVRFAPKSGEFFVLTPKLGEFRRLYIYKGGKLHPITSDLGRDVSDFFLDRPRKQITYQVNDGGYTRLFALDAKSLKPLSLPKFTSADHVVAGASSWDGRYQAIEVESYNAPRSSLVLDWRTRQLSPWVVSSSPEVDMTAFAKPELEYFPARDGTRIPIFVRRPNSCKTQRCPVIVDFHGGPEGQSKPSLNIYAQLFVEAGFVFVQPNVRGSDGYGKSWLNSDNGPKRLQVITDIEDCARYIKGAWAFEGVPPKIGISGGSYGGYSSYIGMTLFAGAYDAGVSSVGMSNLVTFLKNTAPYRRKIRATEYGDLEKDLDSLVKLSPTTYIDRVRDPMLIIQGVNDPRVPVGEAVQFHETLSRRNIPVQMILFGDEGHQLSKRKNITSVIGHTLNFFEKHLKDPQK